MTAPDLRTLQRWMRHCIRHRATCDVAIAEDAARALVPRGAVLAGEVIRPSATMQPVERLDVYNGGYLARLVEVLEADYEVLRYALGDERWAEVARGYVEQHPSHSPDLNTFGSGLPAWVATLDLPYGTFIAELATLEWAITEAFHAAEFEPLDTARLDAIAPEQWASAVLRTNPSVRLLRFDHPVNRYLQERFDGKEPTVPPPAPTHVVVYRKGGRVWRVNVPAAIHAILTGLHEGQPFAAALERAGTDHGEDLSLWFREWSSDGVFVAVELPD